jgi:hypothetical protein
MLCLGVKSAVLSIYLTAKISAQRLAVTPKDEKDALGCTDLFLCIDCTLSAEMTEHANAAGTFRQGDQRF